MEVYISENEFMKLDTLMSECKKDLCLMEQQRQFIDPHLRKLKKQDVKKYKILIRKHNWRVYL